MATSKVYFIFFKFKPNENTLHLVFANKDEKTNYISVSSPITKICLINDIEYEITTKSDSHYFIDLKQEIIEKYNKELEIFKKLMKN